MTVPMARTAMERKSVDDDGDGRNAKNDCDDDTDVAEDEDEEVGATEAVG